MRALFSGLTLALLAGATAPALAQNCGSGGGTTVCATANGGSDRIQLDWTVSGPARSFEIYRNVSADPTGRVRLASVSSNTTSYVDASASPGTRYWYWVRFATNAGSYNSGAAPGEIGVSCKAARLTPFSSVDGSSTQSAAVVVNAGSSARLSPQADTAGTWGWSGCGTSGTAREQTVTPSASCTATVTHTVACGAKASMQFTVTVPGVMRNISALDLSRQMSPGWNLGNSLDAPSETAWGNPPINQALLNAVKAAGFRSVRIPVTWTTHVDANDTIDPAYMARVTEVVKYARNAGLYAIINVHHEGHWLNNVLYANQAANNARLARLWTQIANNFKYHDDYLLFAGHNEVGKENAPWGQPPLKEWTDVQNGYHQAFVNAVRATGGNNASRHLVVQGYWTNVDSTLKYTVLPTDTVANRLFIEIHMYDPYDFALNAGSSVWQWGAIAKDPAVTETWANEAYMDAMFQSLKTRYVDQGVPVLMGEYGAILKSDYDPAGVYRTYWTQYVTRSAFQRGIVPVWWDNGYDSNHQFGLFNRTSGAQYFPDLVKAVVDNAK